MEFPRSVLKMHTSKLENPEDIKRMIEMHRQQRKLKLSKLLEDVNVTKNGPENEMDLVAKSEDVINQPKNNKVMQKPNHSKGGRFLSEMQAHATERQMKNEEARKRREESEREKEALRLATEQEERSTHEEAKRQRIKEYWRKRREEKELESKKELDRAKFWAQIEVAQIFDRNRLMKQAMNKFKNIIKWKIRNENVAHEMSFRIGYRNSFARWRNFTIAAYEERKIKVADDWRYFRMKERAFRTWKEVAYQCRMMFEKKLQQADAHYIWYMKWKVLEHWRHLHEINDIENECERRRQHWRSKINELIPHLPTKTEIA